MGSLNAEYAVLGSLLIDGSLAREIIGSVDERDFISPGNRMIFQAARKLLRTGEPVDAVTIRGVLGEEYTKPLLELMEITPTAANWREYADIMHRQAALGRIRAEADKLVTASTLEECREAVATLTEELSDGTKARGYSMREMLDEFMDHQEAGPDSTQYITWGFPAIDGGTYARPGQFQILAGRPSDGKTALALQIALHVAKTRKVGFFSLETDHETLCERLVACGLQVSSASIYRRELSGADWGVIAHGSPEMATRNLTVLEAAGMTVTDMENIALAYGFEVVVIDYLQLVAPEVSVRETRAEAVADISRRLHAFAQKHGVLIMGLSQLSRAEKGGQWREPELSDLRESGQLEQDADLVAFIHRPSPKSEQDQETTRILRIAKNKRGRLGRWPLSFDGDKQTFAMLAEDDGSRAIMRQLVNAGQAAKAKRKAEARRQMTFNEVSGTDAEHSF